MEIFNEYNEKLLTSLPMRDTLFLAKLNSKQLFYGNLKEQVKSQPTAVEAAGCFLDSRIERDLKGGDDDSFLQLLSIMEEFDPSLKILASEIKHKLYPGALPAANSQKKTDNTTVRVVKERNYVRAKQVLSQECPKCFVEYKSDEMIKMAYCDHTLCKQCFVKHFNIVIKEEYFNHFHCPVCAVPNLSSDSLDIEVYLKSFGALIQANMSKEMYDVYMQLVNERMLMKNPNFLKCCNCETSFVHEGAKQMVQCPNVKCDQQMCIHCKKPWEPAHDGISCEQFAQWKIDSDPKLKAQGLAVYLYKERIECPNCWFKYDFAFGGCLHFRCIQCPAEFCIGCHALYKKGDDCAKYVSCLMKGIHAHHPRDCWYYLRDESVDDLQKLLNDNNVKFDTRPSVEQVRAAQQKHAIPVLKCKVMINKEMPDGPIDEECGCPVENGHAGLCARHYKEYLGYKINQNHIDPLPLYHEPGPLKAILRRVEIKVPDQLPREQDEEYCKKLKQYIKEKLPLEKKSL